MGADQPMEVAYRDPILRAEGLAGDRFGDALEFFALTQNEVHHVLCDCHYHGTMTGKAVASRLHSYAKRGTSGGVWKRAYAAMIARWM